MNVELNNTNIEEVIIKAVQNVIISMQYQYMESGWLSLKEGAKYAGVSYNTLMKYRTMGLQVCEIDGVKRISRKEIDRFFQEHSF